MKTAHEIVHDFKLKHRITQEEENEYMRECEVPEEERNVHDSRYMGHLEIIRLRKEERQKFTDALHALQDQAKAVCGKDTSASVKGDSGDTKALAKAMNNIVDKQALREAQIRMEKQLPYCRFIISLAARTGKPIPEMTDDFVLENVVF